MYISEVNKATIEDIFTDIKRNISYNDRLSKQSAINGLYRVSNIMLDTALYVVTRYDDSIRTLVKSAYPDVGTLAEYVLNRVTMCDTGFKESLLKSFKLISQWQEGTNSHSDIELITIKNVYNALYAFFSKYYNVIVREPNPNYKVLGNIISLKWCTITMKVYEGRVKQVTKLPNTVVDNFEIGEIQFANWVDNCNVLEVINNGTLAVRDDIVELAIRNAREGLNALKRWR